MAQRVRGKTKPITAGGFPVYLKTECGGHGGGPTIYTPIKQAQLMKLDANDRVIGDLPEYLWVAQG